MSQVAHNRARRRRHAWLALPLAALMALLSPAGVAQSTPRPELTVMTRNLYLGSSLTPALVATDPGSFLGAVATIYGTAQSTNFPARAEALADEIETHLPDLVGLQEVTRWETSGPGVPPTQDFLSILTGELEGWTTPSPRSPTTRTSDRSLWCLRAMSRLSAPAWSLSRTATSSWSMRGGRG